MGSSTRTLVVSPDPGLVQQVRSALDSQGVSVVSADSAATAVALVATRHHALVIAAAELPDGSGYELARRLKVLPDAPVVLLVGGDRDGKAIARSHNAGADGFLHRPLRSAELLGRLRDLLGEAWFELAFESDSDELSDMVGVTGVGPHSMVDPLTGVFVEADTGFSLQVIDDGDSMDGAPFQTEELPALAFEQFDEDHPVSVPVSADVTAHGMRAVPEHEQPDRPAPVGRPAPTASAPVAALGPDTGGHPPVKAGQSVATEASVDARIEALMKPGGALSSRIEEAVAAAVSKALADVIPAVIAGLDKKNR